MRHLSALAVVIGGLFLGACRTGSGVVPRAPEPPALGPLVVVPVAPAEFAARTREVLREGAATTERRNRLAGVVDAQLGRAEALFAAGATEAGLNALEGAFLLVRAPEDDGQLFTAHPAALLAGADACARGGSEGRALALYERLAGLLPAGPARDDVQAHLAALARWRESARAADSVTAAGFDQRLWSSRTVFDPSAGTLRSANDALVAWVQAGLGLDPNALNLEDPRERASALEAYGAVQSGSAIAVALHLRHGDAAGALASLSSEPLVELAPPGLVQRVEAASTGEAAAWADLFALFAAAAGSGDPELRIPPELARAAAWGAAVELYRAEPASLDATFPLARLLQSHGMTEVLPLVLADGLGTRARSRDLGTALALVLDAVATEGEAGRMDVARATFAAAAPILAAAERVPADGRLRPSPARLHFAMAALEARAAAVEPARAHVLDALRVAPNDFDALTLLAAVERQRHDDRGALDALDRAARVAEASGNGLALAATQLMAVDVRRNAGAGGEEALLRQALVTALAVRGTARSSLELARAERLLARALELYGAKADAARATRRAIDAARSDVDELAATLIDGGRRALTLGQVPLAREVVREALEADIADEDLVYVALWLELTESRAGVEPDGTAAEALAAVETRTGWVAALREWGAGALDAAALTKAASSPSERVEARFYTGLRGDPTAALREVAESSAIQLVEVMIARDLLLGARTETHPALPAGVELP